MTGMTASAATAARLRFDGEKISRLLALIGVLAIALVMIVLPLHALLSQSLEDSAGNFIWFANFISYAKDPLLRQSVVNSVWVASLTVVIVVPLGFVYAYALTRSCIWQKALFKGIGLLPILAPSLLPAIALIFMFGNQGYLKALMLGHSIYGPIGIVIAQVFHCFPYVDPHPDDGAGHGRSPRLRSRRNARHLALAHLLDDHVPVVRATA